MLPTTVGVMAFKRLVSGFVVLSMGLAACTSTPQWTKAQEKNFLSACLRQANWVSRDKCVPLSNEIRALVLLGAPQKCLLAAASEIVIAPDKETEDAARATLELCLES